MATAFFRAISDQLAGDDGDGHAAIRRITMAYIRANPHAYAEFFADGEGIDAHLLKVSQDNAEAGQHEVDAASKYYGRTVGVHQMTECAKPIVWHRGGDAAAPLQLAFVNGDHDDTVHYADAAARKRWAANMQPVALAAGQLVVRTAPAPSRHTATSTAETPTVSTVPAPPPQLTTAASASPPAAPTAEAATPPAPVANQQRPVSARSAPAAIQHGMCAPDRHASSQCLSGQRRSRPA